MRTPALAAAVLAITVCACSGDDSSDDTSDDATTNVASASPVTSTTEAIEP